MESPGLYAQFHQLLEKGVQWLEKEIIEQGGNPEDIRKTIQFFKYIKNQARQCRILDISVPDVAAVLINSYCISWYTNYPFFLVLLCMCFLGIIVHRVLGIRTKSDKWLFPDAPLAPISSS